MGGVEIVSGVVVGMFCKVVVATDIGVVVDISVVVEDAIGNMIDSLVVLVVVELTIGDGATTGIFTEV